MITPVALLAALRESAGGLVAEARAGSTDGAPPLDPALAPARAEAVLAAWTGARLHAGLPGLLTVDGADAQLLIGDWCYAHALRALAAGGDLHAIAQLAAAITAGASGAATNASELTGIWAQTASRLAAAT